MFTGLIRHLGTLEARRTRPCGLRLRIAAEPGPLERAEPGASVCVHGACLTSVAVDASGFEAELSEETVGRTRFLDLPIGADLHLEPSLRVGDPLDGHFVMGHVDGLGRLLERPADEGLWRFGFPPDLAPLIAAKGSIAVDGISLTVVDSRPGQLHRRPHPRDRRPHRNEAPEAWHGRPSGSRSPGTLRGPGAGAGPVRAGPFALRSGGLAASLSASAQGRFQRLEIIRKILCQQWPGLGFG